MEMEIGGGFLRIFGDCGMGEKWREAEEIEDREEVATICQEERALWSIRMCPTTRLAAPKWKGMM